MDGPNTGFFKRDRLRLGLAPTPGAALAVAVIAFDLGARAGDNFKPLDEKEIRATIAGKDITDGAHWSLHLRPDGALAGIESGAGWTGAWNVQNSNLCRSNPGRNAFDCYGVSGENVSLRLKANDDACVGVVEKHKTN
jgi:hypothetical protein